MPQAFQRRELIFPFFPRLGMVPPHVGRALLRETAAALAAGGVGDFVSHRGTLSWSKQARPSSSWIWASWKTLCGVPRRNSTKKTTPCSRRWPSPMPTCPVW
jgi:hypothetical protein